MKDADLTPATGVGTWPPERGTAEATLRENEQRFRAFVNASSDVVFRMNADWSEVRELDGKGILPDYPRPTTGWMEHFIVPEDRTPVRAAIDRAIRSKAMFELEHRVIRLDGSIGWTFTRAVPALGEDGDIAEWLGTAKDITVNREVQEVRRELEERQTFLLQLSDLLRPMADPQAIMSGAAELFARKTGLAAAHYLLVLPDGDSVEVAGGYSDGRLPVALTQQNGRISDRRPGWGTQLRNGEAIFSDDNDIRPSAEADASRGYGIKSGSAVPLMREGRLAAILVTANPEPRRWTEGEKLLQVEVADRTWAAVERARAEAARVKSNQSFTRLFEASPAPFLVLAPDSPRFTIIEVNSAYLTATMRTREEVVGRALFDAFPDNPDEPTIGGVSKLRASLDLVLATRRPDTLPGLKYDIARPDGTFEERWWSPVNSPVLGEDGEVEAIIHNANDVTEERRALAMLRESEERFREQFDNANDFIFTADLEMRITSGNPAVARALGHSVEELIGRSISEFVPPEMWERSKAMLAAKMSGESDTTRYEVEVFDTQGERMTWEINSRLIRDASGAPTGLHAIGRDISERKASEQALRESEERFRRIADSTPAPMWVTGLDRKREFVNRAYVDFLGISYEEAVDFDWREILHSEDHDRIVAESIAGEASLEEFVLEARYQRKDGEWHWMRSTSQPRFGAGGELTGFIGVAHDVTKSKTAEVALRESEGRLRLIYDSLDEYAIFTLDRTGLITSWNEGATRLLGYSEKEAVGMDGRCIFTPEDRRERAPDREIETALAEGRATNERWHLRKDGSRFWGSGAVLSMLDAHDEGNRNGDCGTPVLVKIMRDDTRRVREEERRKLLLSELQHRVRNTLGIVRSIARQSKRGHESVDDYVTHLVGRMDALARTQVLLTREADARVDLRGLICEELLVQARDQEQIVVRGPDVSMSAKAAEVLTLAVHELATNAAKYGALATGDGRLTVTWQLDTRANGEWLVMQWVENAGRAMPPPTQIGFGTELIERRVPYELHGEAEMRFTPEGLHARIAFPLVEGASVLESGPGREMSQ